MPSSCGSEITLLAVHPEELRTRPHGNLPTDVSSSVIPDCRNLEATELSFSSRCYSPHGAYAQSKLALVLFTYHMQRLLAAQGSPVTANVVDPGVVNTDLYKHVFWGTRLIKKLFGWWFFKTPDEGAWTSVYAAVTPDLEGIGGRYLYNEKETKSLKITYDLDLQRELWARSCQMTGITDMTQDTFSG